MGDDAFTCTCYMDEVGNVPAMGDVLSWSESSAWCMRTRCWRAMQPQLGHHRFDGVGVRVRATVWAADRRRQTRRLGGRGALRAKARGAAFGFGHRHARDGDVPYITGLDAWLGDELDGSAKAYLKDMGAACASNGSVGLYHVEGLTPEAREQGRTLVREGAQVYVIDDAELERVRASYPVVWKNADAKPKLCFMGARI